MANTLEQLIESIVEQQLNDEKASGDDMSLSTDSEVEPKNMDVRSIAASIEDEIF